MVAGCQEHAKHRLVMQVARQHQDHLTTGSRIMMQGWISKPNLDYMDDWVGEREAWVSGMGYTDPEQFVAESNAELQNVKTKLQKFLLKKRQHLLYTKQVTKPWSISGN
jgi:hypothetical protein